MQFGTYDTQTQVLDACRRIGSIPDTSPIHHLNMQAFSNFEGFTEQITTITYACSAYVMSSAAIW
jgi:hypothetical protein